MKRLVAEMGCGVAAECQRGIAKARTALRPVTWTINGKAKKPAGFPLTVMIALPRAAGA